MEALFCPLSSDWGTWGDWIVGLISAGAVVFLGWKANQLGQRANDIAHAADKRVEESEAREARALLLLIHEDVRAVLGRARALNADLQQEVDEAIYATHASRRADVAHALINMQLVSVLRVLPRIHVLPPVALNAVTEAFGLQQVIGPTAVSLQGDGLEVGRLYEGHAAIREAVIRLIAALETINEQATAVRDQRN